MVEGVASSALNWWIEAGVDTLADETPRNWLAPIPMVVPDEAATAQISSPALPQTLEAFRQWMLTDLAVPGNVGGRLDAFGDAKCGTIILVDMPEATDRTSGTLLSGEIGALFDRMIGAIGLARADIYLIPFSPSRPTTGRVGDPDVAKLTPLLRHHLTLAPPKRLLLLGDAPAQALLGRSAAQARDAVHAIDLAGTSIPTVASIHPRIVHLRREYRPLVWADLQRFAAL